MDRTIDIIVRLGISQKVVHVQRIVLPQRSYIHHRSSDGVGDAPRRSGRSGDTQFVAQKQIASGNIWEQSAGTTGILYAKFVYFEEG